MLTNKYPGKCTTSVGGIPGIVIDEREAGESKKKATKKRGE
jgi:hypothetical protein